MNQIRVTQMYTTVCVCGCVCKIVSMHSKKYLNMSRALGSREEHPLRWKCTCTSLLSPSPSFASPLAMHMQQGPRLRCSIAVCCAPDEKAKQQRGVGTCPKARKHTFVNHSTVINIGFNGAFFQTRWQGSASLCALHFSACHPSTAENVTVKPPPGRDDGLRGLECIWIHLHKDCGMLTEALLRMQWARHCPPKIRVMIETRYKGSSKNRKLSFSFQKNKRSNASAGTSVFTVILYAYNISSVHKATMGRAAWCSTVKA